MRRIDNLHNQVLIAFLHASLLFPRSTDGLKLRTWLGPNNMISGTAPYPRAFTTLTSAESKLYIFGGFTNEGNQTKLKREKCKIQTLWHPNHSKFSHRIVGDFDDIFQFNTATLEWIDLSDFTTGATPYARDSHGVTHCAGRLYVFGGFYGPGENVSFG
jgi:hypothetical protein